MSVVGDGVVDRLEPVERGLGGRLPADLAVISRLQYPFRWPEKRLVVVLQDPDGAAFTRGRCPRNGPRGRT